MRVLVVEDHPKLAMAVGTVLRREGMAVDVAFDGDEALAHLAGTSYDVVVLDRDLPGVHGDDVCRTLVAEGCETRVLMLTAAAAVEDLVEGLGWVPTTTWPSRSRLPSWWHASARCPAGPGLPCHRRWSTANSSSIPPIGPSPEPASPWR